MHISTDRLNIVKFQSKLRKLNTVAVSVNLPMIQLMERVNFQLDSIRKNHFIWNGQSVNLIYIAIFND